MIRIITDSTADLSRELIDRYNLGVLPLTVTIRENSYKDGLDIDSAKLFELVSRYNELPKTSAIAVGDFIEAFNQPDECIYIGLSSALSATYHNAVLATQISTQNTVRLIDSKNLSTGIGMLAVKAAELHDKGMSGDQIVETINASIPRVRTSFVIDTLEYLYKGGRCSAIQNVMGSLLKIRPIIEVRGDGALGVKGKIRGTRKKALDTMLDDFKNDLPNIDMHRIFITHTGCHEDANYLKNNMAEMSSPEEICITLAGSVIASHCGPNTIGILFLEK